MEYYSAIKMNDLLIYAKHMNDTQKRAVKETRHKILHALGFFLYEITGNIQFIVIENTPMVALGQKWELTRRGRCVPKLL